MKKHLEGYLLSLTANHFAKATITKRKLHLNRFINYLEKESITNVISIEKNHIESFKVHLSFCKDKLGRVYSFENINRHLIAVKYFFSFLADKGVILLNPTTEVSLARLSRSLPSLVLSPREIESLFDKITDLRDRTIMEVFYATGIRRHELTNLKLEDINFENKTIRVKDDKTKNERFVPISKRAINWLNKYLENSKIKNHLFEKTNKKLNPENLSTLVNSYFKKAGYSKGSCHVFRHSLATNLLESGMDTRYIQVLLGHENLFTTQVYTRVSIKKLQEIHEKTHPLGK